MEDLRNIKKEVKNILITRTDRLGDVILTLPLISAAKKIFENARVIFLVKRYTEELIKDYEGIDELLIEENAGSFRDKYNLLGQKKIDLVINVKPEFKLALLFFLSGIKYRIGTGYRWYSFLYNYKVYEHRKISEKHESEYNLNLLKNFFDEVKQEKKYYFKYSDIEKNNLNRKLSQFRLSLDENFIILHPGSGNSAKDLPFLKWQEYINSFSGEFNNYKIVFTGSENETDLVSRIKSGVDKNYSSKLVDLCVQLNLRELMILIDNSKLFISNSTGPIHIAGALNKNIIGFYPNEKPMSAIRWKPPGDNSVILTPDGNDDMSSIKVPEILNSTRGFLI